MAEINDDVLKKIEELLNETMCELVYGPGGDPNWHELQGSATCFRILKLLNLPLKDEEDIRWHLESNNICDHNFLK